MKDLYRRLGYAGPTDDVDLIKETFTRFEEAVREIRRHLVGIKQQNFFVMK